VQNYYPFGSDMGDTTMNYTVAPNNLYKYSGKELQTELDLDSYDFGARHYDPRLGRWMTMDPLGITSEELSPYNYVENNPMNLIDPDGMQANGNWSGVPLGNTSTGGTFATGWALGIGAGVNAALNWKSMSNAFDIRNAAVSKQDWTKMPKPQNSNPYLPGQQAIVSQWKPGVADRFKNSNPINGMIYGAADNAYVAIRSVFWPVGEVTHINGAFASPSDKVMAIGMTALNFVPLGKGGIQTAKTVVENVAEQGATEAVAGTEVKSLPSALSRFSRLEYHFGKHASEWGGITKIAYYKRALALLDGPVGGNIKGFTNSLGYTFRINMRTGEFGIMRPDGVVETFFRRLKDPAAYWAEQIAKHGK
jgi:RHS repeat-associated protein